MAGFHGANLGDTPEGKALVQLLDKNPEAFEKVIESLKYLRENPRQTLIDFFGGQNEYTGHLRRSGLGREQNYYNMLSNNPALMSSAEHALTLLKHSGKGAAVAGFLTALSGVASANTLKEAGGKLKDAALNGLEIADPTIFGVQLIREAGPGALEDIRKNGDRRRAESRVNPKNLEIQARQDFILSEDHPGQLNKLKMQINGKPVDITAALKDPSQRQLVLDEISKREAAASTPDMKQQFSEMKVAATEFIELEGRRKQLPAQPARVAEATPAQPAPAMA